MLNSTIKKNKDRYRLWNHRRKTKNRRFFLRFKRRSTIKCMDCGEDRWQCLDFHRRNPSEKNGNIAYLVKHRASIKKIKEEIRKCDIVCANCHRIRHNGFLTEELCSEAD